MNDIVKVSANGFTGPKELYSDDSIFRIVPNYVQEYGKLFLDRYMSCIEEKMPITHYPRQMHKSTNVYSKIAYASSWSGLGTMMALPIYVGYVYAYPQVKKRQ